MFFMLASTKHEISNAHKMLKIDLRLLSNHAYNQDLS